MHILLATVGVGGDNLPVIPWAKHLMGRGHQVTMIGNGAYAAAAAEGGVDFCPVITPEEHLRRSEVRQRSPLAAIRSGLKNLLVDVNPVYTALLERYRTGETLIAAHGLCLGARLFHDRWNCPLATFHFSPTGLRSRFDDCAWPPRLPRWLRPVAQTAMNRHLDRALASTLNEYRCSLELRPLARPVSDWMQSPELILGFWPDWFAAPQRDWPPEAQLCGFPIGGLEAAPPLSDDLQQFLLSGPAPIVFSHSTGHRAANAFFLESLEVVRRLGSRAIFLAPSDVDLPSSMPDGVIRCGSAPHLRLYPHAALAVHHGGAGTAAAALASGVPQFVVPAMLDQPEISRRLKKLGVADWESPRKYTARRVVERMRTLMESPEVRVRCSSLRDEVSKEAAFEAASNALEQLGERHELRGTSAN